MLSEDDLNNRFKFHPATEGKAHAHEDLRAACLLLAQMVNELVPDGREKSLSITHLEEVMMWGNAGIARN